MQFQTWFFNGYGLAGLLALLIIAYAVREHLRYSNQFELFEGHIQDAIGTLSSIKSPTDFYQRLKQTAQTLENNPVLGKRWREYRSTLLAARADKPLRSPRSASEFFNDELYRSGDIDVRAYEALPNQFVGIGLCLTFFGLIFSLFIAQDVISSSAEQASTALSSLLQAASFKFITSVVALVASVVFVFAKNRRLFKTEKQIATFCEQIERLIPPVTPEELAEESNQELVRQGEQIDAANKILATGIADALEHKLTSAMIFANEPLLQTMRNMTERLSDINRSALEHMAQRFSETLAGAAQSHTDMISKQLEAAGEAIGEAPAAIRAASVTMRDELQATGEAMDKVFGAWSSKMMDATDRAAVSMQKTTERQADVIAGAFRQESTALLEGLSTVADELASAPGRIEAAGKAFEAQINTATDQVSSVFDAANARVADAYDKSAGKVLDAGKALDDLIERTERMTQHMHGISGALAGQLSDLMSGATEVTGRLGGITSQVALVGEAAVKLAGISDRIESVGGDLSSSAQSLAEVARLTQSSTKDSQILVIKLGERAMAMDDELKAFNSTISNAVKLVGERIETASVRSGQQLHEIDGRVANSLQSLSDAIKSFNTVVTSMSSPAVEYESAVESVRPSAK